MAGDRHQGAFIFGAVLGAIAGAAATLFLTPRSGDSLRAELTQRGRDLQERAEAMTAVVQERAEELATTVQGRSLDLLEQGRQKVGLTDTADLPVPAADATSAPYVKPVQSVVPAPSSEMAASSTPPPGVETVAPAPPVTAEDTAIHPPVTPGAPAGGEGSTVKPEPIGDDD